MKIVWSFIVFLCFVKTIRGQSEVDDNSEIEAMGDSEWWSRRITKIDRNGEKRIGLASEDNESQPRRWKEETVIRDPRRRPRPFASVVHSTTEETRTRDRFPSRYENFHNDKDIVVSFDSNIPAEPSPILLPPYATPSPVYRNDIFDKDVTTSELKNESSSDNPGKSSIASALDRVRIYEITTSNSTYNGKVGSKPCCEDDSSTTSSENNERNRWMDLAREVYVNRTKMRYEVVSAEGRDTHNLRHSIYIDETPRNNRIASLAVPNNTSNPLKSSRGNRRYQDALENGKSFMRKQLSESGRYDWRRRKGQRSNHFRFTGESNRKVGSVPGVPGRDYPIHQEHTHHRLRNTADRFPCPPPAKSHVYLADRASRCQIFYVCYGSMTGVPMVCPNGTLFSESLQVCDWWFNVIC